jgi:acetolactate synthase-1/2/3 large subunit
MHQISAHDGAAAAAAYVADVGQHQMWAAQSIELGDHQRFLTSGGMGAMGFGLPAAIGAAVASGQPVVLIAGDGGFQLNIQELQTIVRNGLPSRLSLTTSATAWCVNSVPFWRAHSPPWGYSAPTSRGRPAMNRGDLRLRRLASLGPERMWRDPLNPSGSTEIDTSPAYPKPAFGRPIVVRSARR